MQRAVYSTLQTTFIGFLFTPATTIMPYAIGNGYIRYCRLYEFMFILRYISFMTVTLVKSHLWLLIRAILEDIIFILCWWIESTLFIISSTCIPLILGISSSPKFRVIENGIICHRPRIT